MSFKIKDNEGIAIPLAKLDAEAAKLWNKELNIKYYAEPSPEGTPVFKQRINWFDKIGWIISDKKCIRWESVIWAIKGDCGELSKNGEEFDIYLEVNKPYFDLIKHWQDKGYTPEYVE